MIANETFNYFYVEDDANGLVGNLSASSSASLLKEKLNDTYLSDRHENSEEQHVSLALQMTTSIQPTSMKSTSAKFKGI
ncbi:unnamed protein product [Rotaria sp. Silwood2]|nr:unnamed protein product [Rotaria sp. Silwood2]CAF3302513.1 unnamed protein product [Rotaria sp. Silwood2]CAF4324989.1 unnamed protein product [Rotaria sp. Silwood2]CAF4396495.1 unnamed protein product [Rotaria sp. Silwood2]CAF4410160.1 unnamed protein product [Rotaria sp. Silwood2]